MSDNIRAVFDVQTYAYILQPGDGTEYRFMITHYTDISARARLAINDNWVTITLTMSGWPNGVADINKDDLQNISRHVISDTLARWGFGRADRYLAAAVLLAARILALRPYDLEAAEHEMLEAGRYAI